MVGAGGGKEQKGELGANEENEVEKKKKRES
jgi:hypothetical protein